MVSPSLPSAGFFLQAKSATTTMRVALHAPRKSRTAVSIGEFEPVGAPAARSAPDAGNAGSEGRVLVGGHFGEAQGAAVDSKLVDHALLELLRPIVRAHLERIAARDEASGGCSRGDERAVSIEPDRCPVESDRQVSPLA